MDSIEAEGHSIDDAIERALQRLGVSRDRVDIEIVSNATRGLFGLGGRRAKVRATLRRPLALDDAPAAAASPTAPAASAAPPRRVEERRNAPPEQRSAAPATAAPATPAPRRRDTPRRAAPPRRRQTERPSPPPGAAPPRQPSSAAPPDAALVERARATLAEIIRLTGVEATVAAAPAADAVRLEIHGDPSGVLIGRRGQTLDAIEYLVNRIASQDDDGGSRVVVDAQDYRARRRQSLEDLALRLAERARRRGKPVTLNPMSPRDRRIVHLALQGDPTLSTRSAGTGYYRKLIIVPEGARRR